MSAAGSSSATHHGSRRARHASRRLLRCARCSTFRSSSSSRRTAAHVTAPRSSVRSRDECARDGRSWIRTRDLRLIRAGTCPKTVFLLSGENALITGKTGYSESDRVAPLQTSSGRLHKGAPRARLRRDGKRATPRLENFEPGLGEGCPPPLLVENVLEVAIPFLDLGVAALQDCELAFQFRHALGERRTLV